MAKREFIIDDEKEKNTCWRTWA